jgi:hypothetical protein
VSADLDLDFSGIRLRLEGLTPSLSSRISQEWAAFTTDDACDPFLRLRLSYADGPLPEGAFAPKAMTSALEEGRASFFMAEGSATILDDGAGEVELLRGTGERGYYALLNLLRACLAWRLPSRGGMLLHAAGLVVGERAFVLVGPEGSGKSSWARLGESAGCRVLSDDLVLMDGAGADLEALGSPLRSTHQAEYRPGRWPLAAVLFPRHGERTALDPVDMLVARARLVANLTFIADAVEKDERIAPLLDRITRSVPCSQLTFALDSSFVELLRGWRGR